MIRRACRATSSSCVTRMIVFPLLESSSNSASISVPVFGVQVARWLVRQQNRRLVHQGPGHGHALPLTAGQFVWFVVDSISQAHVLQRLQRDLPPLIDRYAGNKSAATRHSAARPNAAAG